MLECINIERYWQNTLQRESVGKLIPVFGSSYVAPHSSSRSVNRLTEQMTAAHYGYVEPIVRSLLQEEEEYLAFSSVYRNIQRSDDAGEPLRNLLRDGVNILERNRPNQHDRFWSYAKGDESELLQIVFSALLQDLSIRKLFQPSQTVIAPRYRETFPNIYNEFKNFVQTKSETQITSSTLVLSSSNNLEAISNAGSSIFYDLIIQTVDNYLAHEPHLKEQSLGELRQLLLINIYEASQLDDQSSLEIENFVFEANREGLLRHSITKSGFSPIRIAATLGSTGIPGMASVVTHLASEIMRRGLKGRNNASGIIRRLTSPIPLLPKKNVSSIAYSSRFAGRYKYFYAAADGTW